MKVWGRARIELTTPGSVIRLTNDCAKGSGQVLCVDTFKIDLRRARLATSFRPNKREFFPSS